MLSCTRQDRLTSSLEKSLRSCKIHVMRSGARQKRQVFFCHKEKQTTKCRVGSNLRRNNLGANGYKTVIGSSIARGNTGQDDTSRRIRFCNAVPMTPWRRRNPPLPKERGHLEEAVADIARQQHSSGSQLHTYEAENQPYAAELHGIQRKRADRPGKFTQGVKSCKFGITTLSDCMNRA